MAVSPEILVELDSLGVSGWRRELALTLAETMDTEPNASTSRELRLLMNEAGSSAVPKDSRSVVDDLKQRRERRRFAT